jgi:hypothetical protein
MAGFVGMFSARARRRRPGLTPATTRLIFVALTVGAPVAMRRSWVLSVLGGAALSIGVVSALTSVPIALFLASDRVQALHFSSVVSSLLAAIYTAMLEASVPLVAFMWTLSRWLFVRDAHWLWLEPASVNSNFASLFSR